MAIRESKSEAIRQVLEEQPAASVQIIQKALAAKRIKASAALIHHVKGNGKRRGRKAATSGSTNGVTLESLLAAKGLVVRLGSIDAARQSLDALAKLIEA